MDYAEHETTMRRAGEAETMRLERRARRTPPPRIVYRSNGRVDTGALERAGYEIKRLRRREVELEAELATERAARRDLDNAVRLLARGALASLRTGADHCLARPPRAWASGR